MLNGPRKALRMMRKFAIKLCAKRLSIDDKQEFIARCRAEWEVALDRVLGVRHQG